MSLGLCYFRVLDQSGNKGKTEASQTEENLRIRTGQSQVHLRDLVSDFPAFSKWRGRVTRCWKDVSQIHCLSEGEHVLKTLQSEAKKVLSLQ